MDADSCSHAATMIIGYGSMIRGPAKEGGVLLSLTGAGTYGTDFRNYSCETETVPFRTFLSVLSKRKSPPCDRRANSYLHCYYCGSTTSLKASFMQAAENCSLVIVKSASAVVTVGSLVL